jgi:hypothetical protein
MAKASLALLAVTPALVVAQAAGSSSGQCISLQGSTACSAFQSASISTNQKLIDLFSFLRFVSDRKSFDEQLSSYVRTTYLEDKFQNTFQCGNVDFNGSDELYPRFTTSVLCNAIVQNSVDICDLSTENSRPLCADACADFAQSEAYLTADRSLCSNPRQDLNNLIRADFINCQLPDGSLTPSSCIPGIANEPVNCGFSSSSIGFCSYCAEGGINSTDTCCYNANAEQRCKDVKLPTITGTISLSTVTASPSPTNSGTEGDEANDDNEDDGGLSGGAIAGIVIGALAGVAILAALLFFCCRRMRRRPASQSGSIFNQPSPARQGAPMSQPKEVAPQGYEVLPGGRVARMSALEGHNGGSSNHHHGSALAAGAAGAGAGYMAGRRKHNDRSSSEDYAYNSIMGHGPPATSRRNGSLSSNSILASSVPQSPTSAGDFSSPLPVASQQSEQLPFFKDYYSQDDIHPGDRVAVLWAYQPRAPDEFALERGDMLKVVGIWDDGWATGILSDERVEEWEARKQAQRDSGVSNASGRRIDSPMASGEIKAFPLVCVCIPEQWRKTIDGEGSTEAGSSGQFGH